MKGIGLAVAAVLLALVVVVGFVYAFGVPQQEGVAASPAAPSASVGPEPGKPGPDPLAQAPGPDQSADSDPAADAVDTAGSPKVPKGAVAPPADPSAPLAIQIPGCVCHSDDPKLVKQHAAYRMNQCAGCHVGGVPTGQ